MLFRSLWIALALLAGAHLVVLGGLLFRRRTHEASGRRLVALEYLPLAGLAVLFFGLALRANQLWAAQRYTGADPSALQVEATGMQFVWYFRYPGPDAAFGRTDVKLADPGAGNPLGLDHADPSGSDDRVTSELVLPAGREVDLTLRAQDVIHGFAIPELRLKQNAVPGTTEHVHFMPTVTGRYAILCTQLCGTGHYRMQATLRVVTPDEFAAWLGERGSAR